MEGIIINHEIHIEPTWEFLPKQLEVLEALKKNGFILYSGAVGSGKTLLLAHAAIEACINNPGVKGIICSLTYTQLSNVVFTVFREELAKYQDLLNDNNIPIKLLKQVSESHGKMKVTFYNGSIIYFLAGDKEEKIRGYTVDFFCIDEPIEIDITIFNQLMARMRGKVLKQRFGLLATNPGAETHWIWQKFYGKPQPGYFYVETNSRDNIYLPDNYVKNMEDAYDEDWARRFLDGKWGAYAGQIYKAFNPDEHVIEHRKRNYKYIIAGIDFGSANPSCILTIGITEDNTVIVLEEYYKPSTSVHLAEKLKKLHEKYKYKKVYCDPSAHDLITQTHALGVPIVKADNDVDSGIAKIKSMFQKNKLYIEGTKKVFIEEEWITRTKCSNLITELQAYRYDRTSLGKNANEKPLKKDDHSCDALRYALIETKIFRLKGSVAWIKNTLWSLEDI